MNGEGHPYQVEPSEDRYWQARHELAAAARALNETVVSTDISLDTATEITEAMRQLTQRLKKEPQLTGFVDMARRKDRGSIDNVMGELVAMAGRSHPSAPALTWHEEPNRIVGEVVFGPAFEGPSGARARRLGSGHSRSPDGYDPRQNRSSRHDERAISSLPEAHAP